MWLGVGFGWSFLDVNQVDFDMVLGFGLGHVNIYDELGFWTASFWRSAWGLYWE